MIFESLKNKKTITAFIKPFGLRLKCKIEEFTKPNIEDENSKDVSYRYKLTTKYKGFTMFFYVDNEKECESWQLQ